jgi:hypothetical protein
MRRSARFWLLKNLTVVCPRIRHEIKPDPHDWFHGSHRALQEPGGPSAMGLRLKCNSTTRPTNEFD